jgi:hypothetical protein
MGVEQKRRAKDIDYPTAFCIASFTSAPLFVDNLHAPSVVALSF